MLSSSNKINHQEFNIYYKKGIKKSSHNFRASLIYSNNNSFSKYSVVITKKVGKTAVIRNKNKRKIYKILRQLYPQFQNIKYGFIFIQKDIKNIHENLLKQELIDILQEK